MPLDLLKLMMCDGSRYFLALPQTCTPQQLLQLLQQLPAATGTWVHDAVTDEGWLDFNYCQQPFSIHLSWGEYAFFARQADCPEALLQQLAAYFSRQLALE